MYSKNFAVFYPSLITKLPTPEIVLIERINVLLDNVLHTIIMW